MNEPQDMDPQIPSPGPPQRSEQVVSFRCIPPGLKKSITQFAGKIDFPVGIAARLLLEFGIEEYRAGRLVFKLQLSWKGWTLYPEAGNRVGRPSAATARRGEKTVAVTYRGIPESVVAQLNAIREENDAIPLGEVARRFFEHGLALNKRGALRVPAPQEWLTGTSTRLRFRRDDNG